ncbi:hypothetical protein BASA83_004315 [Batrachochytrium salamandrivorans]|nr:hypothetical protein BASA62_007146 [Batrachochytrium salamandrivorans]KAH9253776.1 hypothetical protein BASA81_008209 [Batrachochytrium salamandrivorans]KAH9273316.1 hypothetical protein BASA83_004315 [Batrachochytrium salamandrivorans]
MRFYALALNLLTVSISVCAVPASTLSSKQFALFRSMLRHRDGNKLLKVAIAAPHITARLTPIHYNQPVQAKPKPVKLKQVHNVNINMHANLEIVDERLNMRQLLSYQILRNHEKLTNKFHQSGTLHTDRWRIGCEQFQEVPPSETLRQTYVVMGKAYYGLELVGGNKSHLAPLQTTINKGIRLFTGARLSTAIGPLLVETGIGSLLTRSLVSRVRLLERSVTKRTPINAICSGTDNDVFTLNVQGAVGKIPALVLVSSDQTAIHEQILADTTSQTKDSQATALVCIDGDSTNMWRLCITPKQLLSTSIAHLVVECEQVTGHRIQSGLVPAIQKSRLRLLGRALDPGVENVYTWLRGGVLNGKADLDQRWLHGTVEHESMGTRHDNRALAARLADFLQVTYRQYQTTLWKYHQGSHCGSWLN